MQSGASRTSPRKLVVRALVDAGGVLLDVDVAGVGAVGDVLDQPRHDGPVFGGGELGQIGAKADLTLCGVLHGAMRAVLMMFAQDPAVLRHRRAASWAAWPAAVIAAILSAGCATRRAPSAALGHAVLVRNLDVLLSEDPERAEVLEESIAAFLTQASTGEFTDDVVDLTDLDRHGIFFRRLAGFGDTPDIGVPLLLKAYTLNGEDYFVTIAFAGERHGIPFLDMVVELKATPHGAGYRFDSPFEERTKDLHETTIDDVCFRYSGEFDGARARRFVARRAELSQLSGVSPPPLEYFAFQSLDEMLKAYGLVFDQDRCNFLGHDLGVFDHGRQRYLTGMGDECYMFGYAAQFLRSPKHDALDRYGTMAVGFKTLFGGYWLLGTPMHDLREELRATVLQAPDLDLLDLFKKGRNGQTQGHAPSLVMAALICEHALKKSNFDGLLRLVYAGSDGERFFAELEALLGIDEAGFRDTIVEMLGLHNELRGPAGGSAVLGVGDGGSCSGHAVRATGPQRSSNSE